MSLFDKFKVGRDEDHGGTPLFSCDFTDPVPIRSPTRPMLTAEEMDLLERKVDAHVGWFDTSNPQEKKWLEEIYTRAANGWYKVYIHKHFPVPEEKKMLVYLEWTQPYDEVPDSLRDQIGLEISRYKEK